MAQSPQEANAFVQLSDLSEPLSESRAQDEDGNYAGRGPLEGVYTTNAQSLSSPGVRWRGKGAGEDGDCFQELRPPYPSTFPLITLEGSRLCYLWLFLEMFFLFISNVPSLTVSLVGGVIFGVYLSYLKLYDPVTKTQYHGEPINRVFGMRCDHSAARYIRSNSFALFWPMQLGKLACVVLRSGRTLLWYQTYLFISGIPLSCVWITAYSFVISRHVASTEAKGYLQAMYVDIIKTVDPSAATLVTRIEEAAQDLDRPHVRYSNPLFYYATIIICGVLTFVCFAFMIWSMGWTLWVVSWATVSTPFTAYVFYHCFKCTFAMWQSYRECVVRLHVLTAALELLPCSNVAPLIAWWRVRKLYTHYHLQIIYTYLSFPATLSFVYIVIYILIMLTAIAALIYPQLLGIAGGRVLWQTDGFKVTVDDLKGMFIGLQILFLSGVAFFVYHIFNELLRILNAQRSHKTILKRHRRQVQLFMETPDIWRRSRAYNGGAYQVQNPAISSPASPRGGIGHDGDDRMAVGRMRQVMACIDSIVEDLEDSDLPPKLSGVTFNPAALQGILSSIGTFVTAAIGLAINLVFQQFKGKPA